MATDGGGVREWKYVGAPGRLNRCVASGQAGGPDRFDVGLLPPSVTERGASRACA